jgi:hypothetical protein
MPKVSRTNYFILHKIFLNSKIVVVGVVSVILYLLQKSWGFFLKNILFPVDLHHITAVSEKEQCGTTNQAIFKEIS